MLMNVRYVARLMAYWLRLYWWWMTSRGLLRFAFGYAVPLVALVFVVRLVSGGDDVSGSFANAGNLQGTDSQVAGAKATSVPTAARATTATTAQPAITPVVTPTVAKSVLTYVVKSGDSLGAICAAQLPSMAVNECVSAIVALNKLSGPDQLAVGQSLSLPSPAGSTTATSQPTTASGSQTPGATSVTTTPRPSATAVPGQQTDAGLKIESLTSPIKPGQQASLKISTTPKSSCTLNYVPPTGTPGNAPGAIGKPADEAGNVIFTWDIPGDTKKGKGLLLIKCGGLSTSSYIDIS